MDKKLLGAEGNRDWEMTAKGCDVSGVTKIFWN